MSFSCFAKKRTKRRRHREGAELIAHLRAKSRTLPGCAPKRACGRSRNQSRPSLCTYPGTHLRRLWSTLTSILFRQKVFRLFVRRVTFLKSATPSTTKMPCGKIRRAFVIIFSYFRSNEPGRPNGVTTTTAPKSRTVRGDSPLSTAWRRRGLRRRSSAGSASPRPSRCGRRRSAYRRTPGPSSFWEAGW